MLKLFIFIFSFTIFAEDLLEQGNLVKLDNIQEEHSSSKFKLMFSGTFLSVSNDDVGTELSGAGGSFQAIYTISKKFGLGGGASSTFTGSATVLNWAFTYSLMGNLSSSESDYSVGGRRVLEAKNSLAEGLRIQGLISQYYFNGTLSTVPYSGIGAHLYYDKYIKSIGYNATVGVRFDQLINNESSLMPITLTFGILI